MSRDELFERVLASLRDAAFDDALWPRASGLIDEIQGSKGNVLVSGGGATRNGVRIFFARSCYRGQRHEEHEREYFEVYHPIDERVPRLRQLPDSRIVPVGELYDGLQTKNSVVYNEMLPRGQVANALHARLDGPHGAHIVWTVADPVDDDGWSTERVETVARLLPHLRHFVRVRHALIDARALGTAAAQLLENLRCGVIQLDWRGRIVAANAPAAALLAQGDGLTDAEGFLHALAPGEDSALQRLIARALPRFRAPAEGGSIGVSRASVAPRLALHVSPLGAQSDAARPIGVAALVLVVDPVRRAPVDPALVKDALGLTAAQSQIAAMLAAGQSTRDIARATGRTAGTVRWHLKQIYARHGISRQAQVVEMVLSLSRLDGLDR